MTAALVSHVIEMLHLFYSRPQSLAIKPHFMPLIGRQFACL